MATKIFDNMMNVIAPIGSDKTFKLPSEKDLAAVEKKFKFQMPPTYKEFIMAHGAGQIGRYFNIRGPGCGNESNADLAGLIEMFREDLDTFVDIYSDAKLIKSCIPFADTIGGDYFVWDINTNKAGEYDIYFLAGDSDQPKKVGANFKIFLKEICLGPEFGKLVGDPNYKVEDSFAPFAEGY